MTVKTFNKVGLTDYLVAVEPQEFDLYADFIPPANLLKTDFMNLGLASIPVRNFCWQHAIDSGAKRHWCFDDNIFGLRRLHKNTRFEVRSPIGLTVIEDFVDKFEDIDIAGMEYTSFAPSHMARKHIRYNARVYSNLLISNDSTERWRVLTHEGTPAAYNEDTDLSLRTMKAGKFTALFHQFLIDKADTHSVKGGNTSEVYNAAGGKSSDNRLRFAACLAQAHQDITAIIDRAGRKHHLVDYSEFQQDWNLPKLKEEFQTYIEPNNYGIEFLSEAGPVQLETIPGLLRLEGRS